MEEEGSTPAGLGAFTVEISAASMAVALEVSEAALSAGSTMALMEASVVFTGFTTALGGTGGGTLAGVGG